MSRGVATERVTITGMPAHSFQGPSLQLTKHHAGRAALDVKVRIAIGGRCGESTEYASIRLAVRRTSVGPIAFRELIERPSFYNLERQGSLAARCEDVSRFIDGLIRHTASCPKPTLGVATRSRIGGGQMRAVPGLHLLHSHPD